MGLMKAQGKVLVVEDDPPTRQLLVTALGQIKGLEVETRADAETALDYLVANPVDLLLFDIALPGMSGWELVEALRQFPHFDHLRLVGITAWYGTSHLRYARPSGVQLDAFFPKPLNMPELLDTVRKLLKGKSWQTSASRQRE